VKRAGLLLAVSATLLYLVLVGWQLDRPLMYDDANFALAAKAVAETGLPFGNQGWMSERGDFSQREQWALWHPPLYVYLEGLFARIGGWSPPVLRLVGVLGGLASAALTFALAGDLTRGPPGQRQLAGGVAVALFVLSPLVVQSTLILDIDFAVLLPLTLLFVLLYLRVESSPRAWLWLGPLFALLLWAKMTNPLALIGVLCVWQLVRGQYLRALSHALGIGLGGVALFGISWLVVGGWLGFPLDMPFGVNLAQWRDSAEIARHAYSSPGAFVEGLQPSVLWLGPGLVTLGLTGSAVRGAQLARGWRVHGADLLIGVVAVFVLGYVNKNAGWFPKYQVALAPLLACLAAPLLAQAWGARPRLSTTIGVLGLGAAALASLALVRDDWALQRTWHIDTTAAACLLGISLLGVVMGLPWRVPAATACAALFGLALGWSLAIDALHLRATYTTAYWYGTRGTLEAAAWVDAHLQPDQLYLSAKEVAIRTPDLSYVDQENVAYALSIGRAFDGTWAGRPLQALVTWQREPYVAELFTRAFPAAGYHETARFGEYVVYVPAPGS
jgi:4-amino-4-deoxy-L-arabinose transferase-like glycosyltransferase